MFRFHDTKISVAITNTIEIHLFSLQIAFISHHQMFEHFYMNC